MSPADPIEAPAEPDLTPELVQLAVEHGEPEVCACGATWDFERALAVVTRSRYASE